MQTLLKVLGWAELAGGLIGGVISIKENNGPLFVLFFGSGIFSWAIFLSVAKGLDLLERIAKQTARDGDPIPGSATSKWDKM